MGQTQGHRGPPGFVGRLAWWLQRLQHPVRVDKNVGGKARPDRKRGRLVQLPADHLLAGAVAIAAHLVGGVLPQRWHHATVIAARSRVQAVPPAPPSPRPAVGAAGLPPPAQILLAFALPFGIQPHLEDLRSAPRPGGSGVQIAPNLLHGPLCLGIPGESMHLAFRQDALGGELVAPLAPSSSLLQPHLTPMGALHRLHIAL